MGNWIQGAFEGGQENKSTGNTCPIKMGRLGDIPHPHIEPTERVQGENLRMFLER